MIFEGIQISEKYCLKINNSIGKYLAFVILGNNPAGEVFVRQKVEMAKRLGVRVDVRRDKEFSQSSFDDYDGVVIQLPLPPELRSRQQEILDMIPVEKDIDGLTSESFARLVANKACYWPAVVRATFRVIDEHKLLKPHTKVAVVGAKGWVGTRVGVVLRNRGITDFSEIDMDFSNRIGELKQADLIISATGQPGLIKPEMVKAGVAAIDLGVMVVEDRAGRKVRGDFDPKVAEKAAFITPVPGGMGPVTVACLFENLMADPYTN